jgi:hypothetical protein
MPPKSKSKVMMKVASDVSILTPTVTSETGERPESPVPDSMEATENAEITEISQDSDNTACDGDCNGCECDKVEASNEANEANEATQDSDDTTCDGDCNGCECDKVEASNEANDEDEYADMPELIELDNDFVNEFQTVQPMFRPQILNEISDEVNMMATVMQMYKLEYFFAGVLTHTYLPVVSNGALAYIFILPALTFLRNPSWLVALSKEHTLLLPGLMLLLALSTASSMMYVNQMF